MDKYSYAKKILNINDSLSIEDINQIYNQFIEMVLSDYQTENVIEYLYSMKILFDHRYVTSSMTKEEYDIWKKSIKEDFSDLSFEKRENLKLLIYNSMLQIIKKQIENENFAKNTATQKNNQKENFSDTDDYDTYL